MLPRFCAEDALRRRVLDVAATRVFRDAQRQGCPKGRHEQGAENCCPAPPPPGVPTVKATAVYRQF